MVSRKGEILRHIPPKPGIAGGPLAVVAKGTWSCLALTPYQPNFADHDSEASISCC